MDSYRDEYGFLHERINPKHNDTTNFILYTSTEIIIDNTMSDIENVKYLTRAGELFREGEWHSSMVTNDSEFSLDNSLGVVCACVHIINESHNYSNILEAKRILKNIPWLHWQNKHPEGLILTWYAKSKLFFPLLWFPFLSMMYGALTPHELNKAAGDGSYQPKTSTHILTILWCVALNLKFTRWCYEKLIFRTMKEPAPETYLNWMRKDWEWYDWENIFLEYYKDENHPNVKASRNL